MFSLLRVLPSLTGLSAGYVSARKNIEKNEHNTPHIKEATNSIVLMFSLISLATYMMSSENGVGIFNIAAEMFGAAALGTCLGSLDAIPNRQTSL